MKVRQATRFDIPDLTRMMLEYRQHSPLECLRTANNVSHFESMIAQILVGRGVIYVAEKNTKVVGMLIALINPNIWDPDTLAMNELAYWVDIEHRNTLAGYKLLKAYRDFCEQAKLLGSIKYYTISKMVNSPDIKYDRFGFEKLEEMWRS
jgi:hypothetical protein